MMIIFTFICWILATFAAYKWVEAIETNHDELVKCVKDNNHRILELKNRIDSLEALVGDKSEGGLFSA